MTTHSDAIARLESQAQKRLVTTGGRTVCWRGFGRGEPLVLLHGGHGSWLHWARNIEALAREHAVWVPDMPGYGDSDLPAGTDLHSLVDDLQATMDELIGPRTPVSLAAFSFGSLATAQIAARRGNVRRIALRGAAGHGGARRPRGQLRNWKEVAATGDAAALADAMRHNLWVHMLHAPHAIDALALCLHTQACQRSRFYSLFISRAGGLVDALRPFGGPVLLVWGEHDVTAHPESAAACVIDNHPERVAHVVEGSGHWVQYEAAETVNRLLLEWMAR